MNSVTQVEPGASPRWLRLLRFLIEVPPPPGALVAGATDEAIEAAYDLQVYVYAPVSTPQLF